MKYDINLEEAKKLLPSAQNILIALPKEVNIDNLASGLALYLSLKQSNKNVSIASEGTIKVEHSNLFGIDKVKNILPQEKNGDYIITLGGVANPDGTIPAAEKADYFPTGSDLNIVIKVKPGQTFTPTSVATRYSSGGFDLIFIIGAPTLADLGSIYANNSGIFSGVHIVNIDNHPNNTNFGSTNIVDPYSACLSEMVGQIILSLQLPYEGDIATNILDGIFKTTNNLQDQKVGADTYEALAQAVRVGGKKPDSPVFEVKPVFEATPQSATASAPVESPAFPPLQFGALSPQPTSTPDFDLSKVFNTPLPSQPEPVVNQPTPTPEPTENFTVPPVVSSSEEKPTGEAATTESPEADWLTPKIYKGSSIE